MTVTRWTVADPARMSVVPAQEGDLVTYADLEAAVTAAYDSGLVHGLIEGRAQAARDVEQLGVWAVNPNSFIRLTDGTRLVRLNDAVKAARGAQS